MKEVNAYTPQEVLTKDFLKAIKSVDESELTDYCAQLEALREYDPVWFNLLINIFGPLASEEPDEK